MQHNNTAITKETYIFRNNSQARKWTLTINNPLEAGLDHDSIRDILLGDIISGSLRLVEAILMAAVLALGMMAAIRLIRAIA